MGAHGDEKKKKNATALSARPCRVAVHGANGRWASCGAVLAKKNTDMARGDEDAQARPSEHQSQSRPTLSQLGWELLF